MASANCWPRRRNGNSQSRLLNSLSKEWLITPDPALRPRFRSCSSDVYPEASDARKRDKRAFHRADASPAYREAAVALFFGRNPKLLASKSASKIGSIMIFAAICTTRSRTVGIPSGRCFPSAFGMYCRLTGEGRYSPARRSACIPSRNWATPCSSMDRNVAWSTPAAPPLLRTRLHASHRTSLL